ncbi:MAG: hypothetical protein V1854_02095 [Methanobacteriota archaeon]
MTRIEVPSETLVVEMGKDGLNIVETIMQMSGMDENAPVICDICSKPLGKMKDVKHVMSPETITIAVRNGFKPEQMLKDTENMLKEQGEKNIDDLMEVVLDSWKSSATRKLHYELPTRYPFHLGQSYWDVLLQ